MVSSDPFFLNFTILSILPLQATTENNKWENHNKIIVHAEIKKHTKGLHVSKSTKHSKWTQFSNTPNWAYSSSTCNNSPRTPIRYNMHHRFRTTAINADREPTIGSDCVCRCCFLLVEWQLTLRCNLTSWYCWSALGPRILPVARLPPPISSTCMPQPPLYVLLQPPRMVELTRTASVKLKYKYLSYNIKSHNKQPETWDWRSKQSHRLFSFLMVVVF